MHVPILRPDALPRRTRLRRQVAAWLLPLMLLQAWAMLQHAAGHGAPAVAVESLAQGAAGDVPDALPTDGEAAHADCRCAWCSPAARAALPLLAVLALVLHGLRVQRPARPAAPRREPCPAAPARRPAQPRGPPLAA